MPARSAHLEPLTLEQLAEGSLSAAEAATASAHVDACDRCAAELGAYTALFGALAVLPRLTPSPGFADAVMARVQLAPRPNPAALWLRRLLPTSRRGWAVVGFGAAAPVAAIAGLVIWVLSYPLVTPTTLWQWATGRMAASGQLAAGWLMEHAVRSALAGWLDAAFVFLQAVPTAALGGAIAFLAVAMPVSAWGLVRLTRIPAGEITCAN